MPVSENDVKEHIMGLVIINYYNLEEGLERFGAPGEEAVNCELQQIHFMQTYIPMNPKKTTRTERLKSLYDLMFLVEKRDKTIKAREYTVVSKRCKWQGYKK